MKDQVKNRKICTTYDLRLSHSLVQKLCTGNFITVLSYESIKHKLTRIGKRSQKYTSNFVIF